MKGKLNYPPLLPRTRSTATRAKYPTSRQIKQTTTTVHLAIRWAVTDGFWSPVYTCSRRLTRNITHGKSFVTRRCQLFSSLPARASCYVIFPWYSAKEGLRHQARAFALSSTMKIPFWNFLDEVFGESGQQWDGKMDHLKSFYDNSYLFIEWNGDENLTE